MSDPKGLQKTALSITRSVGSPTSIVIHTILFVASFALVLFEFVSFDRMLLILTTIVSLEAIYLSLFIQMTINFNTETIVEVGRDIDEIQEDIDEMQEDVEEIQEDVDELQEDVEDISEEAQEDAKREKTLADIQVELHKLVQDIAKLQNK
jgi:low affinity Fe/Cu permease